MCFECRETLEILILQASEFLCSLAFSQGVEVTLGKGKCVRCQFQTLIDVWSYFRDFPGHVCIQWINLFSLEFLVWRRKMYQHRKLHFPGCCLENPTRPDPRLGQQYSTVLCPKTWHNRNLLAAIFTLPKMTRTISMMLWIWTDCFLIRCDCIGYSSLIKRYIYIYDLWSQKFLRWYVLRSSLRLTWNLKHDWYHLQNIWSGTWNFNTQIQDAGKSVLTWSERENQSNQT